MPLYNCDTTLKSTITPVARVESVDWEPDVLVDVVDPVREPVLAPDPADEKRLQAMTPAGWLLSCGIDGAFPSYITLLIHSFELA